MAVAADRADCGAVLVIAFSLRAESSKFESFGTDCRSRQPASHVSQWGLQDVWDDGAVLDRLSCRASYDLCGVGAGSDINRQHMFCLSYSW